MKNDFQRTDRISEEVRREVDRIIREDLHDPRISGTFSVTRCEVTRDLRHAKLYISVLEDEKRDGFMKALKSAAGFIRHELGSRIIIRYTPELQFVSDMNIAYGVHIASILNQVSTGEERSDEAND